MAFSPVGASRSIGDLSRRKVPTDWLGWYARTRPIDTFQYLIASKSAMRSPDWVSRGRTISISRTLSSSLHRGSLVRLYHLNYRSEFITSILAFGTLTIARSRPRGSNLCDRARAIEDDDNRILSCLVGAPAIRTQYIVTHAVLLGIVQVTEPDGTPFRQRGPCRR